MTRFLEITTGALSLGNGRFLVSNISAEQVEELGVHFIRDYHAGVGWQIKSLQPTQVDERTVYLTLTFHQDSLAKVSMSFLEQSQDAKLRQAEYAAFLEQELGTPTTTLHGGLTVIYQYGWGTVSATYDPRNDSSAIHVSWK